ncbi:MAG: ExbD/TolR family protein [Bacteroidales bacterium]|nr:biopolymer transporter ExbD [Bacteroidales bacterium]MDY3731633.1 biopolymer transporter ExbD [Alloprevotella sp.]MCI6484726.1 biopolymer transporter ExbD [Bacteroidales bacterium]MCI7051579.1 biopolymer transporter ExbD [Bacteroidales bacterium]MDY4662964.1 biopolymer transporter ExbD [Alloprevotella sp.]
MGRFKVKKQDTFIDMTPMSDVMVLLLTFFMLTATFVKEEPIKVNTPGSVSEVKIPENNLLTIFIEKNGKVFMTMDSPASLRKLANAMNEKGSLNLNAQQVETFAQAPTFGTPLNTIAGWLETDNRNELLIKSQEAGIPCDSLNNELKTWVSTAREACGEGMGIAIKADKSTSYAVIKKVMDTLRDIDEARYKLITSLKGVEE